VEAWETIMTKRQLATALAEALNILNGLQADLEPAQQGGIHRLFATIPPKAMEDADFTNNGSMDASQLENC
jgi:hypothetical protein